MGIKVEKINKIFIKKMMFSLLAQLLILSLLIFFVRNYIKDNENRRISEELLIKDQFTLEKIGQYRLLQSNYALDLELHNLSEKRNLDNIKFVKTLPHYQCNILNLKQFKLCRLDDTSLGISAITVNHRILGYILASKKYYPVTSDAVTYDFLLILLSIIAIFTINIGLLFLPLKKKIENNTRSLLDFISKENHENHPAISINIEEYRTVANRFVDERNKITTLQMEKSCYEARRYIAEQVAHDIRSPLVAISTAIADILEVPEKRRIMIKSAASRINEIANNLLLRSKAPRVDEGSVSSDEPLTPEVMLIALENIIGEKQYEYLNKIDIQLTIDDNAYHCFAEVHLTSFKRVLSNLINNSIEASIGKKVVNVKLGCSSDTIHITITDDGTGIPSDILPNITEQGFSFGKEAGAGFGLYHAKEQINRFNGKLLIKSEINVGTQVTIQLPQCSTPQWFCGGFTIQHNACVVILDDDPSIHDTWETKLSFWPSVKREHFSRAADLTPQKLNALKPNLYLIDYELLNDSDNGLDVIEFLGINDYSCLVTNCFEDYSVRSRAEKLGVKIIPKSYVPYVSICVIHETNKVVLIDDDEIIRMAWQFAAAKAGRAIDVYAHPNDFTKDMHQYSKDIVIYIDSDLKCEIPGEIYAKEFYENGFGEIYVTSGYEAEKFSQMDWIKAVIGKTPPF